MIEALVRTQYGDLTGVIQIDGHSNVMSLYKLCADYKFDTKDKLIIGLRLSENTILGVGEMAKVSCSILYVRKQEYGNSFDEVATKIKANKTLKLQKKNLYINYSDIGKYVKRYDFLVMTEIAGFASEIEIDELPGPE